MQENGGLRKGLWFASLISKNSSSPLGEAGGDEGTNVKTTVFFGFEVP